MPRNLPDTVTHRSYSTLIPINGRAALLPGIAFLVLISISSGCGANKVRPRNPQDAQIDLYTKVMDGTVGSIAVLEGGGEQIITGYGLVVGLAGNGSSEVPAMVRKKMVREMGRRGIGDSTSASRMLSPDKLIDDLDTAVVNVSAITTPGMPAGTQLDVEITALPGSQAISLDGGILYKTDLRTKAASGMAIKESLPLGSARGEILVNPFLDNTRPDQIVRRRRGVIPGGGELIGYRALWLTLPRADYGQANMLQSVINGRFPGHPLTASAKNPTTIEINIPQQWQKDYIHFLDLMTHLYVRRGGPFQDMKMRTLTKDILDPGAPGEDISLIWEAMGRQVLPVIKPLLGSDNELARYYSSRAGARLEDTDSIETLTDIALKAGPYQIAAITELGRCGTIAAVDGIKKCFNIDDDLVRIAAFHAMLEVGAIGGVQYERIGNSFDLYVIPTTAAPFIYATRSKLAAIVIFGDKLLVRRPVFFSSPDGLITINSSDSSGSISMYRKIGAEGKLSGVLKCSYKVDSLVKTLGGEPELDDAGKVKGLGLTYSQVIAVMQRLCNLGENRNIPAEFVLQKPIFAGTISATRPTGGRANTAAE